MYQIFISYRRDGGEAMAQLLFDRLQNRGYSVFYDIESLKSGPFDTKIYARIEECEDFILILPAQSLDRCIYDEDWVRNEIRHALKLGKNIIPIMMRGFVFPNNLPDDIATVSKINGVSFENMEYLEAKIERISSMLSSKPMEERIKEPRSDSSSDTYRHTSSNGVIIGNVCSIGSNDCGNCWPTGHYSQVINREDYQVVYFHLSISRVPKGIGKVKSGFSIYNSKNALVFDDVTEFDWEDDYDKIARSWIIRGDNGSFVASGIYRAEFWVEDSSVYEYEFEITHNENIRKTKGFFASFFGR